MISIIKYAFLSECLKGVINTNGVVYGAFSDGILKGFTSVDGDFLGKNRDYINLSSIHVKEKANKEGDFLYLTFKNVSIDKLNASIEIDNTWAIADSSKETYLSGGGIKVKFHKNFGKWKENSTREVWVS